MDLYLIHSPRLANPDIPTVWAQMEKVKEAGFAKLVVISLPSKRILKGDVDVFRSIGISNFGVADMTTLLNSAKFKPAVNQVYPFQTTD